MKKTVFIILICFVSCIEEQLFQYASTHTKDTKSLSVEQIYYWANGRKIYLSVVPDKYFVIVDKSLTHQFSTSATNVKNDVKINIINSKEANSGERYCSASVDSVTMAVYRDAVLYSAPYLLNNQCEVGLTNVFYVALKTDSEKNLLYKFAEENNVTIISENFIPLWYKLSCTSASTGNALELANKAYESGLFAATDVQFYGGLSVDALYNDTYFTSQWNLTDTYGIQIEETHSITTGDPEVVVAVIDNGIRLNHTDLIINNSWDAMSQTSPGRLYYDPVTGAVEGHGTMMTSVIGATLNNANGIAGIAPGVSLLPISLDFAIAEYNDVATAIYYAADNNARVISNSWSYENSHDVIKDAMEYALNKGCVIVQSSGNKGSTTPRFPYGDCPNIIVVGNTTIDGNRRSTSNYGNYLDIVAPGTNITMLSASGDVDTASGTSPACAHVSAVVALMLSVNPNLTRQEVTDIIEKTARKLPAYTFSNTSGRLNGTWNEKVGYGLVNCLAAVRHAYYQHESLIEFEYSGAQVSMRIKTQDDVSVFWDYDMTEVTHISAGTVPYIDTTITHTYSSSGIHHIIIAEPDLPDGSIPSPSAALIEFELPTGVYASNIDISHANSALRYIKIVGGDQFEPQALTIENMIALEELYLVGLKYADVTIRNCSELETICTSPYVWTRTAWGPELIEINSGGTLNPNLVGGSPVWPTVPEPVIAPRNLNISGCSSVSTLSLENVNCTSFSFGGFPSLRYVYLSSLPSLIVGAGTSVLYPNPGYYLSSSIATLPDCPENSMPGTIVIRAINNSRTSYIPVSINAQYKTTIENTCSDKGWGVIWDSGVTVL